MGGGWGGEEWEEWAEQGGWRIMVVKGEAMDEARGRRKRRERVVPM